MDNFEEVKPEIQDTNEVDALWITEDIRSYIYDTAKWGRFLSIVGIVISALTAMSAMNAGAIITALSAASPGNPMASLNPAVLTVIYLLFALFIFYPSFLLYKFSTAATQAVLYADQPSLSIAMGKMKSLFKFWGILMIIFISLYVLATILLVIGTVAGK